MRGPIGPSAVEQIAAALDASEAGDTVAWERLIAALALSPDGSRAGDELGDDLTTLPGWKAADTAMQERILAAAGRYLGQHTPDAAMVLDQGQFTRADLAGDQALRLLLHVAPETLTARSAGVWLTWTPIIL